jgi:hypothetical protein
MKKAVKEWNQKTGRYWDQNGELRSLPEFLNVVGIPYNTLKTCVMSSKNKTKREVKMRYRQKRRQAHEGAIKKLASKGGDVRKITKLEIASILLVDYRIDVGSLSNKNNRKPALVARLLVDAKRACEQASLLAAGTSVVATIQSVNTVIAAATRGVDSDSNGNAVHGGHIHEHHFNEDLL